MHIKRYSEKDWKIAPFTIRDESCNKNFFAELLKRDLENCNHTEIEEGTNILRNLSQKSDVQASVIVSQVNSFCIGAIRSLKYEEIEKLFNVIALQESIKEHAEVALLRLMTGIKTQDYSQFYAYLEANNNKIIKHLVKEIDDASIYFWTDKKNYTNFIGALVWMFNKSPASLEKRWSISSDAYATRVINLNAIEYESDISDWSNIKWSTRHNSGVYNAEKGTISLYEIFTHTQVNPYAIKTSGISKSQQEEFIDEVSPLTPIILVPNEGKLPLVATALGENDLGNNMYIVPAIFLKYNADKIRNDYIEKGIVTTLDVATIAISGGTALATKVHWVRRAWALAEVTGAVGNIAINTQTIDPNSDVAKAVDAYNLAMGVIGIKNLGQGGYKFIKNLPDQTKKLLQENKGLKGFLTAKYLEWKTLTTNIDNLTDAEKQLIAEQEKVWKTLLGVLPKNTYLYNPNMAEKVRNTIIQSGVSMEKFVNINYKASHGMASAEEITWLQNIVKKHFPKPKQGEKLRKVMTEEDFVKYYKDVENPTMIKGAGFITKVEDYTIPKSSEELIENLRLDYQGTKFSKEKGFVVIEYENPSSNVEHPFNRQTINDDLPYTNTGMTGSKHNIIPEYHSSDIVTFSRGDILRVYDKKGIIIETYILEDLNGIKVWKKQ